MSTPTERAVAIRFICTHCKNPVTKRGTDMVCDSCGRVFPIIDGIPSFLSPEERFNQGDFQETQINAWTYSARLRDKIRSSRLLTFLNFLRIKFSMSGRRDRLFYDEMHGGSPERLILDIGCGGGRHYFCDYGTVIGVEPVLPLAKFAAKIYAGVVQCNALTLPFADGTFDYVVSSDVIGHIVNEEKDKLFAEIHRVLKKGGRTVHVSEADSTSPMLRFAHRYPALFKKHFVDKPGHIGLELPSELKARFERHGFRQITFRRLSSNLQACGTFVAFFDNEYLEHSRTIRWIVRLDRLLARSFVVMELLHFPMELLARIDDALTPLDHAGGVLVVFEK